jgi:hypothetical protein
VLSLTVLRRGVGAGHTEDTMGEEERAGAGVVELTSIVTLHIFNGDAKLCFHIGEKMSEGRESIRFQA